MYLAGHKQPATTARYMRPQKEAAEEVLRSAAAATGRLSLPSDRLQASGESPTPKVDTDPGVEPTQRRGPRPRRVPPAALRRLMTADVGPPQPGPPAAVGEHSTLSAEPRSSSDRPY